MGSRAGRRQGKKGRPKLPDSAPKASPKILEIERRMLAVEDLYLRQHSQREIATIMRQRGFKHISQKTVSRDIERMRAEWREKRVTDLDVEKEKQLSKLDAVERAAWAHHDQTGDGADLRVVLDCVAERAKILGLYAPKIREWRADDAMRKLAAVLTTSPDELPT